MKSKTHLLMTSDDYSVRLREHASSNQNGKHCWIVVPGFLQHSQTKIFHDLCEDLASMGAPVFCLDLRGTGESDGRFSFGDAEFLDVIAAIKFARQNYSDVKLLGFSLGAYSALRAHCEFPESIRELFLVSCPTSVLHIILQGHALKHSLSLLFEKPQFHKERNFAFRWGNPFPRKPSAEVFAIKAKAATHFLVGSKDYLVPPKMSSKVFGLLGSQEKTWKLIDDGHHAELLYIADPVAFKSWLQNP